MVIEGKGVVIKNDTQVLKCVRKLNDCPFRLISVSSQFFLASRWLVPNVINFSFLHVENKFIVVRPLR